MIEKPEYGFREKIAVGLASLGVLFPNASAQQILYSPLPPPEVYYILPLQPPPPLIINQRTYLGGIPAGTNIRFGGIGYGRVPLVYDDTIPEREAGRIIKTYLKRNKIHFGMDKLIRFRVNARVYALWVDFQLSNGAVIEYRSAEDELVSDLISQEIKFLEDAIARDWSLPTGLKPEIFFRELDRRGIVYERNSPSEAENLIWRSAEINYRIIQPLDKYKETGGKVFIIEKKISKNEIEQELEKILPEATKNIILTEKQAEDMINEYLGLKGIKHKRNAVFRTNGLKLQTDFLVEVRGFKLPLLMEYLGEEKHKERKERDYQEYEKIGGKVFRIEATTKEELSSRLESIVDNL